MAKVYIETSMVSYLVARRSRDLIVAARQQLANDWWDNEREKYDLFISEVVLQEARLGDPGEIAKRMQALAGLSLLKVTNEAHALADELLKRGALPVKAQRDALHIAVATANGIDYLLSWNCKHIANAHVRRMVERIFRATGYEPSVICTPEELGEIL
ncbi:MAG: type II toxin-antitoxin system VapC family toxin [Acidobacteria bacterium]|nr:type II toxin-antitoxin system VapC family toxin [Acidobacteriota bacterium]MBI3421852.1 type II toxin-antitoxin system VapC family toxin [Acidobacteriota bacterium]